MTTYTFPTLVNITKRDDGIYTRIELKEKNTDIIFMLAIIIIIAFAFITIGGNLFFIIFGSFMLLFGIYFIGMFALQTSKKKPYTIKIKKKEKDIYIKRQKITSNSIEHISIFEANSSKDFEYINKIYQVCIKTIDNKFHDIYAFTNNKSKAKKLANMMAHELKKEVIFEEKEKQEKPIYLISNMKGIYIYSNGLKIKKNFFPWKNIFTIYEEKDHLVVNTRTNERIDVFIRDKEYFYKKLREQGQKHLIYDKKIN